MANTDNAGKLILRVTLGALILLHGVAKVIGGPGGIPTMVTGIGLPAAFGYLVYVGEVLAPILLIIGLWSRIAAAVIAINMVVAISLVHAKDLFALSKTGGWALELQGMYLLCAVALVFLGAGRYSVGGNAGKWN